MANSMDTTPQCVPEFSFQGTQLQICKYILIETDMVQ